MADDAAHKRKWQTFEVVFGLPFLVALVLQLIVRISLPRVLMPAFIAIGILLIVAGVWIVVLARREFTRHGQPTDPGFSTSQIITTGVFAFSRNPLYLGGIFVLAGISLTFNLAWGLILLIPSVVACHFILIVPEERYLLARFGEQYQAYASEVNRWIGRK